MFFGIFAHCPEFEDREETAFKSDSNLTEEYGSAVAYFDGNRNQNQWQRKNQKACSRKYDIQRTFDEAMDPC